MNTDDIQKNIPATWHKEEHEEEVDLKKYLYIVVKKKWILFSFITVALVINLITASKHVPQYQATALVLIERPSANLSLRARREDIQPQTGSTDYYNTQYEILKSEMMVKRVSDALDLKTAFKTSNPEGMLRNMISVDPVSNTRLVKISITYTDSEMATKMVNTLVDFFMQQNVESMLYMSQEVLKLLPEDAEAIKEQAMFTKLQDLSEDEIIESLPSVAGDPILSGLRSEKSGIETQLFNLGQRYKDKHPTMVRLHKRLDYIDKRINDERGRVVKNIKADLMGALRINNIRVIDYAKVPAGPLPANTAQNVLYGVFFSAFLGLGVIFLTEYLDDSIKNQQDIENKLALPYLGEFPLLGEQSQPGADLDKFVKLEKTHEIFEAIRNIRTNIIFSTPRENLKTILLTSTIPQEGKSFLASYLAFSFAKNGEKTLLLDGDVRKPSVHKIFSIERSPGLTNMIAEDTPAEDVIRKSLYDNLHVITAGSKTPNPLELLGSEKLADIMKGFFRDYEKIVIDTPPSLMLSDALVLSRYSDATILVVRSGAVSKDAFGKLKSKFNASNSKILGVILNFFEVKKHSHYYKYRYYHKYYKSYYASDDKRRKEESVIA